MNHLCSFKRINSLSGGNRDVLQQEIGGTQELKHVFIIWMVLYMQVEDLGQNRRKEIV